MTIIERFTDTTGIVKAESVSIISRYPVSDVINVMSMLPQHHGSLMQLATVPCSPGERFLLMRPAIARNPVWFCVCPMKASKMREL